MSGFPLSVLLNAQAFNIHWKSPEKVVAGLPTTWVVTIQAFQQAMPAHSRIALVWRWPSDWDAPQCHDPQGLGYTSIKTSTDCSLRWRNYRSIEWHPFDHVFEIELLDRIDKGQQIEITLGDTVFGSLGMRPQTFYETAAPISIRFQSSEQPWCEISRYEQKIVADLAHVWTLIAPTDVVAEEIFDIALRIEDKWCNPAKLSTPPQIDGADWVGQPVHLIEGVFVWPVRIDRLGTRHLSVSGVLPLVFSNPMQVHAHKPKNKIFWGDIHGQSLVGCGARTVDNYFSHAKEFARLNFSSHQANCFLVTQDEWRETQEITKKFNQSKDFVALLGLEWSASTEKGGDRNLYFSGDQAQITRCSHEYIMDVSDLDSDLPTAPDLHKHYQDKDVLIALHVGGRTTDLSQFNPALERLVEIHSTHATSEWFYFEALSRGYRVGVIAGSDGVDGRPGTSHPGHQLVRNVRSGLVAVPMPNLNRNELLFALKNRNCYATTGERIRLTFNAGSHEMGAEFKAPHAPTLSCTIQGTAPLESIDFFRGAEIIQTHHFFDCLQEKSNLVRIAWKGATRPGNFSKARMVWDGSVNLSKGRFESAKNYSMDTPDEGIAVFSDQRIEWKSKTGGDWDGVIVQVNADQDAVLTITTPQISSSVGWGELSVNPLCIKDVDPLRELEVLRLPTQMPSPNGEFEFKDEAYKKGWNAYWIRVRQIDGHMAWSSPIFVYFD